MTSISKAVDSASEEHSFKIDFSTLFNTLCKIVTIDQATLLLYLLLHRNRQFYQFAMAQDNLQQMVIPILQTLYNAPDSTSHHIYMTLIVLLILSEDDGFNKSIHQIVSTFSSAKRVHFFSREFNFDLFFFECHSTGGVGIEKYSLVHRTLNIGNITWWPSNFSCDSNNSVQHVENAR